MRRGLRAATRFDGDSKGGSGDLSELTGARPSRRRGVGSALAVIGSLGFAGGILVGVLGLSDGELADSWLLGAIARESAVEVKPAAGPAIAAADARAPLVSPELQAAELGLREEISRLEAERDAFKAGNDRLADELGRLGTARKTALLEVEALEGKAAELEAKTAELEDELARLAGERRSLEGEIEALVAIAAARGSERQDGVSPRLEPAAAGQTDARPEAPRAMAAVAGQPEREDERPNPRILLHVSSGEPETRALAEGLAAHLGENGLPVAGITTVHYPIAGDRIRFFHAEDAVHIDALRAALGRGLEEQLGTEATVEVQDYTSFEPEPSRGTLEIWLADR
jgi:hypothetical protein